MKLPLRVECSDDVARLVLANLGDDDVREPFVVVLGVDSELSVTAAALNRNRQTHASLTRRDLLLLREEFEAAVVVVVEVGVAGAPGPTHRESREFDAFARDCATAGVTVLDCLVMCGHRWWSLRALLAERAASN